MSQISARAVSVAYGTRVVLDAFELVAGDGERLGMVGENGSGKSTLLRVLAGRQVADGGVVSVDGSRGFVDQQPDLPAGGTVSDAVDAALGEFRAMQARMRELEERLAAGDHAAGGEYGDLLASFEHRDGWSADARAARAVAGLGLGSIAPTRRLDTLSGGQRARLALALALVTAADVLLLDEPTNHLDDDALEYLESALREHRGVIVLASHDRAFLDAVCTSIVDLDPALRIEPDGTPRVGPARYTGTYSDYLGGKAAARVRWEQAYVTWNDETDAARAAIKHTARQVGHGQRERRDNDKFVAHFLSQKVDSAVARRVRDAETRLARLEEKRVPKPARSLRFGAELDTGPAPGGVLVAVREVVVPDRLTVPALDVTADTRLMVTGPNGSGKSTLLAVLAGALAPESGSVLAAPRLRIGWLPQTGAFPDPSATALEAFAAGRPENPGEYQGELVGLGLIAGRDVNLPVGRLSVGQQRRLALARLVAGRPQLLLLDEPTNHLSLALIEELESAVDASALPTVVVTHDRWARRRWTGQRMSLAGGRLENNWPVDARST